MVNSITFVQNVHQHKASKINIHYSLCFSIDSRKQNLTFLPPFKGGTGYFWSSMNSVEPLDISQYDNLDLRAMRDLLKQFSRFQIHKTYHHISRESMVIVTFQWVKNYPKSMYSRPLKRFLKNPYSFWNIAIFWCNLSSKKHQK